MPKTVTCSNPRCRTVISAEGRQIGDTVQCPKCGRSNQVLAEFGTEFDIPDTDLVEQKEKIAHPARLVCTNCGAVLGVRDAVCPKCGGDVRTGKTIIRITKEEKERAGLGRLLFGSRKGAKGRKTSSLFVVGVVVAGLIVVAAALVGYLLLRK